MYLFRYDFSMIMHAQNNIIRKKKDKIKAKAISATCHKGPKF